MIEPLERRTLLSGGAALAVTVERPLPTVSGGEVSGPIDVKISNDGPNAYHSLTSITLYASPSKRLSRSATKIQSIREHLRIAAGNSEDVDITIRSAPSALNGRFYIVAQVAAPTTTVQGTSRKPMDFPPFVELGDAFNSNDPPVVQFSDSLILDSLTIPLEVTNLGNEPVHGTLKTLIEISASSNGANANPIATVKTRIDIAPGATDDLKFSKIGTGYQLPSGQAYFVAVIDPQNAFGQVTQAHDLAISTVFFFS